MLMLGEIRRSSLFMVAAPLVLAASLSCQPAHALEVSAQAEDVASARVSASLSGADIVALVDEMEASYQRARAYTAVLHKRERISGRLLPAEAIEIKFRKPFSVYLKWVDAAHAGQESIFVRGWNQDKVRAHQGHFPDFTVNLSPTGRLAMRGNRHPITEVGIGHIIALIGRDIRLSAKVSGDEVRFVDYGTRRVFGRPARCVEAVTPGGAAYYAYRATICIDLDVGLPVEVTIRDERDQIVEQYGYERLQTNPGLTDSDFDPSNQAYGF